MKHLKMLVLGLLVFSLMMPVSFAKKGGGEKHNQNKAEKSENGGGLFGFGKGKKKGWKGEQTPPGWSKGKKKGWGDEKMPPGLAKKQGVQGPVNPANPTTPPTTDTATTSS